MKKSNDNQYTIDIIRETQDRNAFCVTVTRPNSEDTKVRVLSMGEIAVTNDEATTSANHNAELASSEAT